MEYMVFSDESYITASRHRAISALSLPKDHFKTMETTIKGILDKHTVKEFKWNLSGKDIKYKKTACEFIDCLISNLGACDIRIDTIVWDTQDSRHKIEKRDDDANFGRMFFHLLKNVTKLRGLSNSWHIFPDERASVDWPTVEECLKNIGKWNQVFDFPLFETSTSKENFVIKNFQLVNSVDTPLCQIADLFGGLAVYSANNYKKYHQEYLKQPQLFDNGNGVDLTRSDEKRLKILDNLITKCRANKLGVSIKTNKRLSTPDPKNPINFWNYAPQHQQDRAPVKN